MHVHFLLEKFFIGARRHSDMAGKIFIEILFVVISDLGGNFGNGNIRFFQQHFCLDYLELIYVFVDGHRKFVRKKLVQIILRYACGVRRLFCRDAVGVIFGDVFRRLAQIFYTRKRMNCVLCDVIVGYLQKYRGEAEIDVGRPVAAAAFQVSSMEARYSMR